MPRNAVHNPLDNANPFTPRDINLTSSDSSIFLRVLPRHHVSLSADLQQYYVQAEKLLRSSYSNAAAKYVKAAVYSTSTSDGVIKQGQYDSMRTVLLLQGHEELQACACVVTLPGSKQLVLWFKGKSSLLEHVLLLALAKIVREVANQPFLLAVARERTEGDFFANVGFAGQRMPEMGVLRRTHTELGQAMEAASKYLAQESKVWVLDVAAATPKLPAVLRRLQLQSPHRTPQLETPASIGAAAPASASVNAATVGADRETPPPSAVGTGAVSQQSSDSDRPSPEHHLREGVLAAAAGRASSRSLQTQDGSAADRGGVDADAGQTAQQPAGENKAAGPSSQPNLPNGARILRGRPRSRSRTPSSGVAMTVVAAVVGGAGAEVNSTAPAGDTARLEALTAAAAMAAADGVLHRMAEAAEAGGSGHIAGSKQAAPDGNCGKDAKGSSGLHNDDTCTHNDACDAGTSLDAGRKEVEWTTAVVGSGDLLTSHVMPLPEVGQRTRTAAAGGMQAATNTTMVPDSGVVPMAVEGVVGSGGSASTASQSPRQTMRPSPSKPGFGWREGTPPDATQHQVVQHRRRRQVFSLMRLAVSGGTGSGRGAAGTQAASGTTEREAPAPSAAGITMADTVVKESGNVVLLPPSEQPPAHVPQQLQLQCAGEKNTVQSSPQSHSEDHTGAPLLDDARLPAHTRGCGRGVMGVSMEGSPVAHTSNDNKVVAVAAVTSMVLVGPDMGAADTRGHETGGSEVDVEVNEPPQDQLMGLSILSTQQLQGTIMPLGAVDTVAPVQPSQEITDNCRVENDATGTGTAAASIVLADTAPAAGATGTAGVTGAPGDPDGVQGLVRPAKRARFAPPELLLQHSPQPQLLLSGSGVLRGSSGAAAVTGRRQRDLRQMGLLTAVDLAAEAAAWRSSNPIASPTDGAGNNGGDIAGGGQPYHRVRVVSQDPSCWKWRGAQRQPTSLASRPGFMACQLLGRMALFGQGHGGVAVPHGDITPGGARGTAAADGGDEAAPVKRQLADRLSTLVLNMLRGVDWLDDGQAAELLEHLSPETPAPPERGEHPPAAPTPAAPPLHTSLGPSGPSTTGTANENNNAINRSSNVVAAPAATYRQLTSNVGTGLITLGQPTAGIIPTTSAGRVPPGHGQHPHQAPSHHHYHHSLPAAPREYLPFASHLSSHLMGLSRGVEALAGMVACGRPAVEAAVWAPHSSRNDEPGGSGGGRAVVAVEAAKEGQGQPPGRPLAGAAAPVAGGRSGGGAAAVGVRMAKHAIETGNAGGRQAVVGLDHPPTATAAIARAAINTAGPAARSVGAAAGTPSPFTAAAASELASHNTTSVTIPTLTASRAAARSGAVVVAGPSSPSLPAGLVPSSDPPHTPYILSAAYHPSHEAPTPGLLEDGPPGGPSFPPSWSQPSVDHNVSSSSPKQRQPRGRPQKSTSLGSGLATATAKVGFCGAVTGLNTSGDITGEGAVPLVDGVSSLTPTMLAADELLPLTDPHQRAPPPPPPHIASGRDSQIALAATKPAAQPPSVPFRLQHALDAGAAAANPSGKPSSSYPRAPAPNQPDHQPPPHPQTQPQKLPHLHITLTRRNTTAPGTVPHTVPLGLRTGLAPRFAAPSIRTSSIPRLQRQLFTPTPTDAANAANAGATEHTADGTVASTATAITVRGAPQHAAAGDVGAAAQPPVPPLPLYSFMPGLLSMAVAAAAQVSSGGSSSGAGGSNALWQQLQLRAQEEEEADLEARALAAMRPPRSKSALLAAAPMVMDTSDGLWYQCRVRQVDGDKVQLEFAGYNLKPFWQEVANEGVWWGPSLDMGRSGVVTGGSGDGVTWKCKIRSSGSWVPLPFDCTHQRLGLPQVKEALRYTDQQRATKSRSARKGFGRPRKRTRHGGSPPPGAGCDGGGGACAAAAGGLDNGGGGNDLGTVGVGVLGGGDCRPGGVGDRSSGGGSGSDAGVMGGPLPLLESSESAGLEDGRSSGYLSAWLDKAIAARMCYSRLCGSLEAGVGLMQGRGLVVAAGAGQEMPAASQKQQQERRWRWLGVRTGNVEGVPAGAAGREVEGRGEGCDLMLPGEGLEAAGGKVRVGGEGAAAQVNAV